MQSDTVFIRGLKAEGVIGVFDWEREIRQTLLIDVTMATDIRKAASTDDLQHTLDYKAICEAIRAWVADEQFQLIETLAETIAARLRKEFSIRWLRLTIHKPTAIAEAMDVGITIERGETP